VHYLLALMYITIAKFCVLFVSTNITLSRFYELLFSITVQACICVPYNSNTQNSFNPISSNSEILIIQHFFRVFLRLKVCFLPEKSFINKMGSSQETCSKGLPECLYINCCGMS
jgi:hypothetical protein